MIQTNQIRRWEYKISHENDYRYFIIMSKVDSTLNEDISVIKIRYLDSNRVETRYARSVSLHSTVISEGE